MPQEIEVWYLIPALRKELAKIFIREFHYSQKDVSDILRITESAVSQYIKAKRANELKFSKDELKEIKKVAGKILHDRTQAHTYLYQLTTKFRGSDNLCKLHRKQDRSIAYDCKMCCE